MVRELTIDGVRVADETDAYVIAEIGHNHQGSVEKARELYRRAADCGVNAVKLQKRHNRTLFTRALYDAPYDNENSFGPTYGAHREALEFDRAQYEELMGYAKELRITMFATAFDVRSADFLAHLGVPAFKIASGDLKNTPLLRHVARLGRLVIVSTGGGTMADIDRAVDAILPLNPQLCLLQCTASYPADAKDMNLQVIVALRERFPGLVIGLSDHQNGIALAPVAYTLGARLIEKHFTVNRALKGTDHGFSIEPPGMQRLVRDLRRTREALGDRVKRAYEVESKPLLKMSKKLTAARALLAGHVLTIEDFAIQSPGDGLAPSYLDQLVGLVLTRSMDVEEAFTLDHVAQPVQVETA